MTSHWGEMVKNDVERNRKWLGHFRGKVLEKLKEADHASPELKKQIKQIIRVSSRNLEIETSRTFWVSFLAKITFSKPHLAFDSIRFHNRVRKSSSFLQNTMKKRRDHIRKSGDNLMEVNEKANVSGNFYQGDILLSALVCSLFSELWEPDFKKNR